MSTLYYSDRDVTVWHGNALDIMPMLDPVDHVITDPPYSEKVHSTSRSRRMQSANDRGGRYGADLRRNVDLGFDHLDAETRSVASREFARLARRWILTFSDVESCHLWRSDLEESGLDYVRTMAWRKLGGTPQFSGDRPAVAFEAITVAHQPGRKRWNGGGKHGFYEHAIVLDRGRTGGVRLHSTQKPEPLMGAIVADFTDAGDTILDPFAGSGTTGAIAKRAGRKAVLIDSREECCEVMAKRLAAIGDSLFDEVTA